ncbi:MAG: S-ribosylhomocysteine lyase [Lachnospiraceae bacterium]|jgi:S-ribosylhomocysteine lyase|nr:S-ribosylhomocysteine lyase [Lachnospiraceae bacterium]
MNKIASFTVNHLDLLTGVYVSRKDYLKEDVLTTFDLRITRPNVEPVMDTAAVHALEHLGATFLRNDEEWGEKVIYFGPMGCRTGCYLILHGDFKPMDIMDLLKRMLNYILEYEGNVPGYSPRDCGNYLDCNLSMAKYYAKKFMDEVVAHPTKERTEYPE